MRSVFRRVLLTMMVLLLAASTVVPAAMAAGIPAVESNASSTSVYAGMRDTLRVYTNGVEQSPNLFRWRSSNSSVVSVNSSGVITGMKVGSATVSATRKSNGRRTSIRVVVKRNKVDNLSSRPSATSAPYNGVSFVTKSVEIVSPSKVVVEYYVCCNYPSSKRAVKVNYVDDAINLYNRNNGAYVMTIVGDDYQLTTRSISGFRARNGKSVQVIKAAYTGNRVHCANVKLANYRVKSSSNAVISVRYAY